MVAAASRIKSIRLRKKLNSLLKSYYKQLKNRGDAMPTVNFPDWTEPILPNIDPAEIYEDEDGDDDYE